MSWQATNAVVRHSGSKGSARLLLLVIANHMGAEGRAAYPSVATLCAETRLSERTVRYLLRDLEASGELVVQQKAGPKGVNLYWVRVGGSGGAAERGREKAGEPGRGGAREDGGAVSQGGSPPSGLPGNTSAPQILRSPASSLPLSAASPLSDPSASDVGQNSAAGGASVSAPKPEGRENKGLSPPPRAGAKLPPKRESDFDRESNLDWGMPLTVAALLEVCGTVRGGWRDETELAATLPWLQEAGGREDAQAAREVRLRFGPGAWDKPTPPRVSQIRREWVRMGCLRKGREAAPSAAQHARAGGSAGAHTAAHCSTAGRTEGAAPSQSVAAETVPAAAETVPVARHGVGNANAYGGTRSHARGTTRERAYQGRQKLRAEYLAAWGEEERDDG